jgi:RNA polymerase sigma-70 factor (ECF subfamily)
MNPMSSHQQVWDCSSEDNASVIEEHPSWLRALVIARVGKLQAAEDILQEVHLAVAKARDHLPPVEEVRSWLCQIAIRQCALYFRKLIRSEKLIQSYQEDPSLRHDHGSDPIYWMLQRERQRLVRQALEELNVESKQMLQWKYLEHLTYAQIAERMQTTVHSVEYKLTNARNSLRQRLVALGLNAEADV